MLAGVHELSRGGILGFVMDQWADRTSKKARHLISFEPLPRSRYQPDNQEDNLSNERRAGVYLMSSVDGLLNMIQKRDGNTPVSRTRGGDVWISFQSLGPGYIQYH